MEIIVDKCECGEEIHIELGRFDCSRKDGKRPHYPDEELPEGLDPARYSKDNSTRFTCRKCKGYLAKTVPAAAFEQ